MVRHGESTWNELGLVQGQDDTSRLTEHGRLQARALAIELDHEDFDAVLSSDLTRAFETATILTEARGVPIVTSRLLRERCFGVAETRPLGALTPELTGIRDGRVIDENARPEGGESLRDFSDRVERFVEEAIAVYAGARLLVVAHGGTIRTLNALLSQRSIVDVPWDGVENCSRWEFDVSLPEA